MTEAEGRLGTAMVVLMILILLASFTFITMNGKEKPCSELGNVSVQDLPARCLKEYKP